MQDSSPQKSYEIAFICPVSIRELELALLIKRLKWVANSFTRGCQSKDFETLSRFDYLYERTYDDATFKGGLKLCVFMLRGSGCPSAFFLRWHFL
jgi:hypothetical protein